MVTLGPRKITTIVLFVSWCVEVLLGASHHSGRVVLMGHFILAFDDKTLLFNAGMMAGDFFDKLEHRNTAEGDLFFVNSAPVRNYPDSIKVNVFANELTSNKAPVDKRCAGLAGATMESLEIKAEWKTGLSLRRVSKMTITPLQRKEMTGTAHWGYELDISSKGVPLTDHLIVSVYGPDSTLLARFSGAP